MTTSIKAKLNKLDRLTNFYKYRVIVFLYYRNEISFRNENKIMILKYLLCMVCIHVVKKILEIDFKNYMNYKVNYLTH